METADLEQYFLKDHTVLATITPQGFDVSRGIVKVHYDGRNISNIDNMTIKRFTRVFVVTYDPTSKTPIVVMSASDTYAPVVPAIELSDADRMTIGVRSHNAGGDTSQLEETVGDVIGDPRIITPLSPRKLFNSEKKEKHPISDGYLTIDKKLDARIPTVMDTVNNALKQISGRLDPVSALPEVESLVRKLSVPKIYKTYTHLRQTYRTGAKFTVELEFKGDE